jgi:hypothetical protein
MFYFLISKGDGSFCFLFCYRPIEIPPQQPRLLSHHRQPIVLADGQVTRWSPIGEEAHGVAFLLGGVVDQSPLLQGLVDMGGVETFQWVTGLVLLEYLAEEGKLTLFLVGRDIIAIGIDVTKQGNI